MAIVYLLNFCFLAMPSLFFLAFFLHVSGSIFFRTGVILSSNKTQLIMNVSELQMSPCQLYDQFLLCLVCLWFLWCLSIIPRFFHTHHLPSRYLFISPFDYLISIRPHHNPIFPKMSFLKRISPFNDLTCTPTIVNTSHLYYRHAIPPSPNTTPHLPR